ncbi:helix-turn-helix transcriptional regulator [Corticimicrobacter populi]|uniref:Transcriptional regulator n=1 Tax=Corticimicrobacter populi TaxID=2175229 RepID=A0A2V1K696_9BURK|nr:transcriptional regulator [Corticimicrobacter populi]PWF25005.1 transcriptional regulator [Corticimicrobacter populi]
MIHDHQNKSPHHPVPPGYPAAQHEKGIYPDGLYRWKEFAGLIPYCRETWRQRVLAGTAPAPKRISANSTVWRGSDLLAWLANPNEYIQEQDGEENTTTD